MAFDFDFDSAWVAMSLISSGISSLFPTIRTLDSAETFVTMMSRSAAAFVRDSTLLPSFNRRIRSDTDSSRCRLVAAVIRRIWPDLTGSGVDKAAAGQHRCHTEISVTMGTDLMSLKKFLDDSGNLGGLPVQFAWKIWP